MFALRVRSAYSLLSGTGSPRALCQRAKELGYQGLAITDRNNLYGLWEFLPWAKREGLRPLVGAEITAEKDSSAVVCLVKDQGGYSNLCRLITARKAGHFCLEKELLNHHQGLEILVADPLLLKGLHALGIPVAGDLGASPGPDARTVFRYCKKHGLLAVATPDSDLVEKKDQELHLLLKAIDQGATLSAMERLGKEARALLPEKEYQEAFAIWPGVVAATEQLAKRIQFAGPELGIVMPPWRGQEKSATTLRRKAYQGAIRRYGEDLGEEVIERLEHELQIIEEMGYSSYFLVVRDIVHRKGRDGIRRRRRICGRGSGAASLVAYCLEITNVCPIRHNLYFERFLNAGRTDPPDIDIDFAWDERDQVLEEVLSDYRGQAAMVCNHVFFQPKMAIRETAKAFGLPGYEISQLTKKISWLSRKDSGLKERLAALPTLRGQDFAPPWPAILRLAERLIGLPRNLSVHPGGVVITPGPIASYVPVETAAKGVPIIQWEKDGAEEAGLVKIDLLGNRSLGVIRDCLSSLHKQGKGPRESRWQPEDDLVTRLAVAEGKTMGCFYIESPAMRLLEKKAGSGDFEQLVIQSSIIRPAANEFCREYVRRLHGGAWQPLSPKLDGILDETYGLMVYQEDVARVAVALAGFSHAEADGLRKVMSKKDKLLRLESYREKFVSGCIACGVEPEQIHRIWQMMMSFDGYSFCKPHSASYARVSFQAAYLKSHHPAEFMAAVISNQGGYYNAFAYVSEAKRMGLVILHPDVCESELPWMGKNNEIRVGLQGVEGLSSAMLQRLFAAREKENFADAIDFFQRVRPADDEARALIHAGALDALEPEINRTALLWLWASWCRLAREKKRLSLFPAKLPQPPALPPPPRLERLRREYAVLGFLCSHHPLELLNRTAEGLVKAATLQDRIGQRVRLLLWLLTGKLVSTRTGEAMEFLTFEDETAQIETTFFPRVYRAHAHLLATGRAYFVTGLVEEDFAAVTLTVEQLVPAAGKKRPSSKEDGRLQGRGLAPT